MSIIKPPQNSRRFKPPADYRRNILYTRTLPEEAFDVIASSLYTHINVSSFHIYRAGSTAYLKLYYNPVRPENPKDLSWLAPFEWNSDDLKDTWDRFRKLKEGIDGKKLFLSFGAWNTESWFPSKVVPPGDFIVVPKEDINEEVDPRVALAAKLIKECVEEIGFDGVDINFEGDERINDEGRLASMAQLVRKLRSELKSTVDITFTPLHGYLVKHLERIGREMQNEGKSWPDALSWVNWMAYNYSGHVPNNIIQNDGSEYSDLLSKEIGGHRLLPKQLVTGVALNSVSKGGITPETLNEEFWQNRMCPFLTQVCARYPEFGGVFAWRYPFTRIPPGLDWSKKVFRKFFYRPGATTNKCE